MKRLTRKLVGVVIMSFITIMATANVMAQDGVWEGSGTKKDPYQIADEADLKALAQNVNNNVSTYEETYFKEVEDITLTEPWVPIGTENSMFSGNFDGSERTISGFSCTAENFSALFAYNNGTIRRVNVEGNVEGKKNVGLIVAYNLGTVSGSTAAGNVVGQENVGLAIGYNAGNVKSVISLGDVTGNYYVAGIVGYNDNGLIEKCTNNSVVTGYGKIGGIAGGNFIAGNVTNCYNNNFVRASDDVDINLEDNTSIGGIVGVNSNSSTVDGSINYGHIISKIDKAGGICGSCNNSIISQCHDIGDVTSDFLDAGAIVGYADSGSSITDCLYLLTDRSYGGIHGEDVLGSAESAVMAESVGVDEHNDGVKATGFYISLTPEENEFDSIKWAVITPVQMKTAFYQYQVGKYKESEDSTVKFGLIVNKLRYDDSIALVKVYTKN